MRREDGPRPVAPPLTGEWVYEHAPDRWWMPETDVRIAREDMPAELMPEQG